MRLAFEERGDGPPVVLVHGIASDRSVWRELVERLDCRTIACDRRAYGESGAPEPYEGTTVGEQADDVAELIPGAATLCGHGFGALVCLDTMLRFPERVRGAVLIEPPMLWLSPDGPETMSAIRARVEEGARDGGAQGAVKAYLGDALDLLGPERIGTLRGFAADLAAVASWPAGRRELRAIEQPADVVTGVRSEPIAGEVARKLADLLPNGELLELDTGHYAQIEDPDAVAAAITRIASA